MPTRTRVPSTRTHSSDSVNWQSSGISYSRSAMLPSASLPAVERSRDGLTRQEFAANLDVQSRASSEPRGSVAQRDRAIDGRPVGPAGHDSVPEGARDLEPGPSHLTAFEHEPDDPPRRPGIGAGAERGLADEALAERDEALEPRLDRVVLAVELVTVERVGGLGPKRIARAEARRRQALAARVAPQIPERAGARGVDEDLVAIPAGVAGAREPHGKQAAPGLGEVPA